MTLAAATVFPSPDGATEAGCEKQNIAVRTWKLIYAAHTGNSLHWRDMIHFEAYLRRASSCRHVQILCNVRYDSQKAKPSIMPGSLFPDHTHRYWILGVRYSSRPINAVRASGTT